MDSILIVGLILLAGLIAGELAARVRLPRISGYIIAGICLNPGLLPLIPTSFMQHTGLVTDIALSFIAFSVGGTLLISRLRVLGKTIVTITVCEAEAAVLLVLTGFALLALLPGTPAGLSGAALLPLGLLLGAIAAPTDPSAILAIAHQYRAEGEVTTTIMSTAALDDTLGIITYSLATSLAGLLLSHSTFHFHHTLVLPVLTIAGGIVIGILFGLLLHPLLLFTRRDTEGMLIVLVFAMLSLCYGGARLAGCDPLLSTLAMGCTVANTSSFHEKVFSILERYTEELVFVLFFTLGGMYLDFSSFAGVSGLILLFVVLRIAGKVLGTRAGAAITGASPKVRRFTALGLIPQGGIVMGLALSIGADPLFTDLATPLINITIGGIVIHELIGPLAARRALMKAGEIPRVAT